jgi:ferritin-like metal-binding protein YciE
MHDDKLREKLVDYIQDAHAMEQNVLRMMDTMISTSEDPQMVKRLKQHRKETERHEKLLNDRLQELGTTRSLTADVAAITGAMLKGVANHVRADKPVKNARDGYITEHTEIAAYQLLERLAKRAGDTTTAEMAAEIRRDEERMARWLNARWDRFIELTLDEAGLAPEMAHVEG